MERAHMKRLVAVVGAVGAVALGSPAFASAGAVIVHNGQHVTLPCVVTGAVDVKAGGSAFTGCEGHTVIQGTLDAQPGSQIGICNATVDGAFIARGLAFPSLFGESNVLGHTSVDGSLFFEPTSCTISISG
jgi:hypothetical protein